MPAFFALYYTSPFLGGRSYLARMRIRNLLALIASYFFYAWGAPTLVALLFFGSLLDYLLSKKIEQSEEVRKKKIFLSISLLFNLGALAYYKYANFFFVEVNALFRGLGAHELLWTEVVLPIGISFYTFQKISYVVDVYRGTTRAADRFDEFALYVALFPQLIAGPIIRYFDVAEQIRSRRIDSIRVVQGLARFSYGLAKKVLIANPLGYVADLVFSIEGADLTPGFAWLGIFSYSMQIYFDFSGYSDMAIGLGRMMGFDFLENFNRPYTSQSFTEFWRRWHISLSNWMREYLYIPLGGNHGSKLATYRNLWIVFLFSGLWHGASWNFVIWGMLHGLFLTLDKLFWLRASKNIPQAFNTVLTFVLVMLTWVVFRAESYSAATNYWSVMFDFENLTAVNSKYLLADLLDTRSLVVLIVATMISFLPIPEIPPLRKLFGRRPLVIDMTGSGVRYIGAAVCLLLSVMSLADSSFNPFIYFRF